jgi:hypothetical protein
MRFIVLLSRPRFGRRRLQRKGRLWCSILELVACAGEIEILMPDVAMMVTQVAGFLTDSQVFLVIRTSSVLHKRSSAAVSSQPLFLSAHSWADLLSPQLDAPFRSPE